MSQGDAGGNGGRARARVSGGVTQRRHGRDHATGRHATLPHGFGAEIPNPEHHGGPGEREEHDQDA